MAYFRRISKLVQPKKPGGWTPPGDLGDGPTFTPANKDPDKGGKRFTLSSAPRLTFVRTHSLPVEDPVLPFYFPSRARKGFCTRPQRLHLSGDKIKSLGPSRRPVKVRININQYPNRSLLDLLPPVSAASDGVKFSLRSAGHLPSLFYPVLHKISLRRKIGGGEEK